MEIQFRPHHFLCTLCFQGKGYSSTFNANYQKIIDRLNAPDGDDTMIRIVKKTDDICSPCPHRIHHSCQSEEKIVALDHAHLRALGFETETKISWGEAKERIKNNISLDIFHQICKTCEWKSYGICENVLNRFVEKK